jgi:hypothetical protein
MKHIVDVEWVWTCEEEETLVDEKGKYRLLALFYYSQQWTNVTTTNDRL